MTNLFYKMPANILQTESIQKILADRGALSLFGLSILMWLTIQETRKRKISGTLLRRSFTTISSEGQRNKVLDSGLFDYDEKDDTYSIKDKYPDALTQAGTQAGTQAPTQAPMQAGTQAATCAPVPILLELDKDIDIEGEENTRETTSTTEMDKGEEIEVKESIDLKSMDPTKGELWEGVLLCCPDQSLRRMMTEHWEMTADFFDKHLKASGKWEEAKDVTSLCDILRSLVQPAHPVFGGLKLFLNQEAKSATEKAFDDWLAKLSNIQRMQEPLSFQQFNELVQLGFDARVVRRTIERLNNYSSAPFRYRSAFSTVKDWLENPIGKT